MKHTRQGPVTHQAGPGEHSTEEAGLCSSAIHLAHCFSLQNRALCAVQAHKRKVTTGRGSHNSDARPSARPGNYPGIETPSREALIPNLTAQSNVPEPFNLSRAQGPTPDVHTGEVRGCVFRCSKPILGPGGVEARGSFPCLHLHIHQSVTPNPGVTPRKQGPLHKANTS